MKVEFDKSIPLVGIGVVPWARLGPERWFSQYEILAIHNWDLDQFIDYPAVRPFKPQRPLAANNAQSIVNDEAFQTLARTDFKDAYFIPYKPVKVATDIGDRMLMNPMSFTETYENKATFRERFAGKLNFAPFIITHRDELDKSTEAYEQLQAKAGLHFVLQHESLSGGKGTYIIEDHENYEHALERLPQGRIVVSALVDGAKERSIQACATRYGTFCGYVQKQIIRDPQICKLDMPDVRMFCGGEIGTVDEPDQVIKQIQDAAKLIGDDLYQAGYRGIFGVDTLVKDGEVYILEVNTRLTGMTPLLTALYGDEEDIPFYLLHVLEQGNFTYEITDFVHKAPQAGGQIILQAHIDEPRQLMHTIQSGIYVYNEGKGLVLKRRDHSFRADDNDESILIQAYVPSGTTVKPADRLAVLFTRQPVLGADDGITDYYRGIIASVYGDIGLKAIEK